MSNDAVRRIMAEVKEFASVNNEPEAFFAAAPLESDLFEWHFTVRGPPDTAFADGVYHGRIVLPARYPLEAPEIILLTHNGRFEVGKRICLSVTSHHQETWRPSWGIRTILTALVSFMPSKPEGIGALDFPDGDRRALARKSWRFKCDRCGVRPIEQVAVPAAVAAGVPGATGTPPGSSAQHAQVLPPASDGHAAPSAKPGPAAPGPAASPTSIIHTPRDGDSPAPPDEQPLQPPAVPRGGASSSVDRNSDNRTAVDAARTPRDSDDTAAASATATGTHSPSDEAPLPAAAPHLSANTPPTARRRRRRRRTDERELLYLAYALGVAIIAVILRRVVALVPL